MSPGIKFTLVHFTSAFPTAPYKKSRGGGTKLSNSLRTVLGTYTEQVVYHTRCCWVTCLKAQGKKKNTSHFPFFLRTVGVLY